MTVFRTYNPAPLNAVANKAGIARDILVPENGTVAFDTLCEQPDAYVIVTNGEDAWMIAEVIAPTVYRCHGIFDTSCRGRRAVQTGKLFIQWFWDNTPALMLIGATPVENRKARMFNRWVGFTSDGEAMCYTPAHNYQAEWFHLSRPRQDT